MSEFRRVKRPTDVFFPYLHKLHLRNLTLASALPHSNYCLPTIRHNPLRLESVVAYDESAVLAAPVLRDYYARCLANETMDVMEE